MTSTAPDPAMTPGPDSGAFLQNALAASAAIVAADRLGALSRLESGPVDAPTLARDCGLGERGARLLLAALASLGVAEAARDGTGYHFSPPR